jgi:predicted site-specific integrase-resolvase
MTDTRYKPSDLLTRHEAAEFLGISVSRLAQHRRAGQIGYDRNTATGSIRFPFSEVKKLQSLRSRTVTVAASTSVVPPKHEETR